MIDADAFTIYPDRRSSLMPYVVRPGTERPSTERREDLFVEIARALDLPAVRLAETGGDRYDAELEQGTTSTRPRATSS